jgi:hypothetical protein
MLKSCDLFKDTCRASKSFDNSVQIQATNTSPERKQEETKHKCKARGAKTSPYLHRQQCYNCTSVRTYQKSEVPGNNVQGLFRKFDTEILLKRLKTVARFDQRCPVAMSRALQWLSTKNHKQINLYASQLAAKLKYLRSDANLAPNPCQN